MLHSINRRVSRSEEVVEFHPVPGYEDDWAGYSYIERSRLWDALGTLPIGALLVLGLLLLGGVLVCG